MSRSLRLLFLCAGAVLLLLPLAVGQPGMPPTLKADEPAYYLMARSLVEDGDLLCETRDLRRLFDAYPYLPVENLILMSGDGWETARFGKPYLVSLLTAPLVALFDARGFVLFNMALFLVMIWMGFRYLLRWNREGVAALFAGAFFVLSPTFVYVFWLQPEILNLFAVAAAYFLVLHEPGSGPYQGRWAGLARLAARPAIRGLFSGAAFAVVVYNKPMLAVLGLPLVFRLLRRRGLAPAAVWVVAAALSLTLQAGVSKALTGQWSAYLGAARAGVKIEDPEKLDEILEPLKQLSRRALDRDDQPLATYDWLARVPDLFPRMLKENLVYFLFGRHTGVVLYMPFAVVALALFLLHGRRSAVRWLTLGAAAAVALFFLVWIHYNWHGGAGFVGNRYFVNVYPALLFLVTAVRPEWTMVLGSVAGGLFLGPLLFTPYGAAVPEPTLQAHVRGFAHQRFPLELTIRESVPGYDSFSALGATFVGRRDLFRVADASERALWVRGAATTPIWITTAEPRESFRFEVYSLAADNEVRLELGSDRRTLLLAGDSDAERRQTVELRPGHPTRIWYRYGKRHHSYRLRVTPATGRNPRHPSGQVIQPQFYLGAQLVYLGDERQARRRPPYGVAWKRIRFPSRVRAGGRFEMLAELENRGRREWKARSDLPVRVSYRWLGADGRAVVPEGLMSPLAHDVPPGGSIRTPVAIAAPGQEGSYLLVLDAYRDQIGWLSERRAQVLELPVEVLPALE